MGERKGFIMLGWRKLAAWFLVYALVAYTSHYQIEIASNNADLIKWVTGFFFGANVLKPLAQNISIGVGGK